MITIIPPEKFKTIPWKNGLGFTTELAIDEGATLDDFDWRLSIASVANDGEFSNFSGYDRNLVLIEGNGITLNHHKKHTDNLIQSLDIAKFYGGFKTTGILHNGAIKDFNVITKQDSTAAEVSSYIAIQQVEVSLQKSSLVFAYSLTHSMTIERLNNNITVSQGSLVKIEHDALSYELTHEPDQPDTVTISGQNMIIATITYK